MATVEKWQGLVHHEARLLDERRYEEWLGLYTDDAVYWIPAGDDDDDPERRVSIAYDTADRLRERVARLTGGHAHAQDPPSRMARTVTGLTLLGGGDEEGEVVVGSTFVLVEYRLGRQHVYGGRYRHRLRVGADGTWRIAAKDVGLVNREAVIDNLTFIV